MVLKNGLKNRTGIVLNDLGNMGAEGISSLKLDELDRHTEDSENHVHACLMQSKILKNAENPGKSKKSWAPLVVELRPRTCSKFTLNISLRCTIHLFEC